jgi:hypothetical protein
VVVQFADAKDEAASFVHLNQQRRPLTRIDMFKAALASGDSMAREIAGALEEAGLSIAPHTNFLNWKPNMIAHVSGLYAAHRKYGVGVLKWALHALGDAFEGEILRYAGTIFPGVAKTVYDRV